MGRSKTLWLYGNYSATWDPGLSYWPVDMPIPPKSVITGDYMAVIILLPLDVGPSTVTL